MSVDALIRPPLAPEGALRAAFAAPLAADAIAAAAGPGWQVEAVQTTGSTNADLLARARQQAARSPWLRAALAQSAGRGRLGRRWHAAPGAALLYSIALPLAAGRPAPPAVTLAVGVALAELLHADLRLKWPNDLLLDGAKLGGVLSELAVDRAGERTLVIGIGLNLWLDAAAAGSIGQPAAALAARLPLAELAAQREALIGRGAQAARAAVEQCVRDGFVPFQPRFMQRFAHLGLAVDIAEQGTRVLSGKVLGVDGDGRLLVHNCGRITAFAGGEVSVRTSPAAGGSAGGSA